MRFQVPIDIYNQVLNVVVIDTNFTTAQFVKEFGLSKGYISEIKNSEAMFLILGKKNQNKDEILFLIFKKKRILKNTLSENINTISHECFHFVHYLLDFMGSKLDSNSEECYAYLMGFVTEKVFDIIYDNVIITAIHNDDDDLYQDNGYTLSEINQMETPPPNFPIDKDNKKNNDSREN